MTAPSRLAAAVLALVALSADTTSAATLEPETVRAWDAHVAATEARIAAQLAAPWPRPDPPACLLDAGDGESMGVPGGTITRWRGAVVLAGTTIDRLLAGLRQPDAHGPYPEDVLALRVLGRDRNALRLFMRVERRAVVTATYDTEHRVTFARHGPRHASSRSVSTRIVEVEHAGTAAERVRPEGDDRGFLWRMNAYWRYTQTGTGVLAELESLTLSRGIPPGLGPVVRPVVHRIARESVRRTLDTLRRVHAAAGARACP